MNPYENFVAELARLFRQSATLPLGGFTPKSLPPPNPNAPKALIFSPHPDDEVVMGGLPLRLQRELQWNVVNVAVTQGSNKARQRERLKELQDCCGYLGFGLIQTSECGLEGVNLEARQKRPADWSRGVARLAQILAQEQPRAIFFPHDDDWNSTHIGTHHLVTEALAQLGASFTSLTVETEFWGAMDTPNLLVESSERDVIDLVTALTFHVGEVQRNPYHLRLPPWLMDNVRRGGELVGGQGGAPPRFLFGTLCRLRRWQNGAFAPVLDRGKFVAQTEDLSALFA
jgi:LmbE family N-acetylglucosaminyl deacetylase